MIREGVEWVTRLAMDCLPRGIMGLNAELFRADVQYIADRA